MSDSHTEDLIRRADDLEHRMARGEVGEAVQELFLYGRRNRALIRVLVLSVVLDIALSVALAYGGWRLHVASGQAAQNRNNIKAACIAGNESRAQQHQLWHYVVGLSGTSPQAVTPAQQRRRAQTTQQFLRYVDAAFAPRDCGGPVPFKTKETTP